MIRKSQTFMDLNFSHYCMSSFLTFFGGENDMYIMWMVCRWKCGEKGDVYREFDNLFWTPSIIIQLSNVYISKWWKLRRIGSRLWRGSFLQNRSMFFCGKQPPKFQIKLFSIPYGIFNSIMLKAYFCRFFPPSLHLFSFSSMGHNRWWKHPQQQ